MRFERDIEFRQWQGEPVATCLEEGFLACPDSKKSFNLSVGRELEKRGRFVPGEKTGGQCAEVKVCFDLLDINANSGAAADGHEGVIAGMGEVKFDRIRTIQPWFLPAFLYNGGKLRRQIESVGEDQAQCAVADDVAVAVDIEVERGSLRTLGFVQQRLAGGEVVEMFAPGNLPDINGWGKDLAHASSGGVERSQYGATVRNWHGLNLSQWRPRGILQTWFL